MEEKVQTPVRLSSSEADAVTRLLVQLATHYRVQDKDGAVDAEEVGQVARRMVLAAFRPGVGTEDVASQTSALQASTEELKALVAQSGAGVRDLLHALKAMDMRLEPLQRSGELPPGSVMDRPAARSEHDAMPAAVTAEGMAALALGGRAQVVITLDAQGGPLVAAYVDGRVYAPPVSYLGTSQHETAELLRELRDLVAGQPEPAVTVSKAELVVTPSSLSVVIT